MVGVTEYWFFPHCLLTSGTIEWMGLGWQNVRGLRCASGQLCKSWIWLFMRWSDALWCGLSSHSGETPAPWTEKPPHSPDLHGDWPGLSNSCASGKLKRALWEGVLSDKFGVAVTVLELLKKKRCLCDFRQAFKWQHGTSASVAEWFLWVFLIRKKLEAASWMPWLSSVSLDSLHSVTVSIAFNILKIGRASFT